MKFVIDRSVWRCGGGGPAKHGTGCTYLLNEQGFMCCLGMVAKQLGYKDKEILNCGEPDEVDSDRENLLVRKIDGSDFNTYHKNSELSSKAIEINDDDDKLNDEERELRLVALFAQEGHEVEFVNSYGDQHDSL